MKPIVRIPCAVLACAAVIFSPAAAQRRPALTEFGAGLYDAGGPWALSGPILYGRYMQPLNNFISVGGMAAYRDDDIDHGRAQALSVGGVAMLGFGLSSGRGIYIPLEVSAEYVSVSGAAQYPGEPRDIGSGVYPRFSYGLGIAGGNSALHVSFEMRRSVSRAGNFISGFAGLSVARLGDMPDPSRRSAMLTTSTLFASGAYARTSDYQGYVLGYQWPLRGRAPLSGIRATVGIDFAETRAAGHVFGIVTSMVGGVADIARTQGGSLFLRGVGQLGASFFTDGYGQLVHPAAMAGLEGGVGSHGVSLVIGGHYLVTAGPEGALRGAILRAGLAVGF